MDRLTDSAIKIVYEELIPETSSVWFHPVLPLVCTLSDRHQVKIANYESGKCLAFFDLFSGKKAYTDPRVDRVFEVVDVVFIDGYALIWSSGSSDVASGTLDKLGHLPSIQSLILIDRCFLVRWDYLNEAWAMADLLVEGKVGVTKGILYDDQHVVLGFEDGTLKLFNFVDNSVSLILSDSHTSSITHLHVFARDLTSKPLVVSAESLGQVFCWNLESQVIAFKFTEIIKGKSVRV